MEGRGYRRKGRAASFGIVALANKGIADLESEFDPDLTLIGFNIPSPWASGKGMDGSNNYYRHASALFLYPVQDIKYREAMPAILDQLGDRAIMGMDDFTWISD